jgi:hypothetical protein
MKFEKVFKIANKDPLIPAIRNHKYGYILEEKVGEEGYSYIGTIFGVTDDAMKQKNLDGGFAYISLYIGVDVDSTEEATCLELKDKVDRLYGDRHILSVPIKVQMFPYNRVLREALELTFEGYDIGFSY